MSFDSYAIKFWNRMTASQLSEQRQNIASPRLSNGKTWRFTMFTVILCGQQRKSCPLITHQLYTEEHANMLFYIILGRLVNLLLSYCKSMLGHVVGQSDLYVSMQCDGKTLLSCIPRSLCCIGLLGKDCCMSMSCNMATNMLISA